MKHFNNMFSRKLSLLSIIFLAMSFSNSIYAQVKVGANPTTLDATKYFEVEADDGNKVAVAKSDGVFSIDNTPAAAATDSILLKDGTTGQVNEMSMSRLSGLLGAGSAGACVPDTDGDGITDDVDTDDDADGVDDTMDNCPLTYGSASYSGCPPYGASGIGTPPSGNSEYTGAVWESVSGEDVIDLSGMAVGQCFDTWPTGMYGVKLASDADYFYARYENGSNYVAAAALSTFGTQVYFTNNNGSTGVSGGPFRVPGGSKIGWGGIGIICRDNGN